MIQASLQDQSTVACEVMAYNCCSSAVPCRLALRYVTHYRAMHSKPIVGRGCSCQFLTSLLLPLLLLLPAATAIKVFMNDGDKEPDFFVEVRTIHIQTAVQVQHNRRKMCSV
jgi:hypothetical protein